MRQKILAIFNDHSVLTSGGMAIMDNSWDEVAEAIEEIKKNDPVLDFGDYALIEQKRYGVENEYYLHKAIGRSRSNTWVDVPVQSPATETMHDNMEDVIHCVCCGVVERDILKYRSVDVLSKNHYLDHQTNEHTQ